MSFGISDMIENGPRKNAKSHAQLARRARTLSRALIRFQVYKRSVVGVTRRGDFCHRWASGTQVIVASAGKETTMVCPKCRQEGLEPGDTFCRHCGFSVAIPTLASERVARVAEKGSVTVEDSVASNGLLLLGTAILIMVPLFVLAIAPWMGWLNFVAGVLPWFSGAFTLVGLGLIFIGFELRHAH